MGLTNEDLSAALAMCVREWESEFEGEVDLLAGSKELDEELHKLYLLTISLYGDRVAADSFVFSIFHFGFSVGRCAERIKKGETDRWWKENVEQPQV